MSQYLYESMSKHQTSHCFSLPAGSFDQLVRKNVTADSKLTAYYELLYESTRTEVVKQMMNEFGTGILGDQDELVIKVRERANQFLNLQLGIEAACFGN